jgi:hypothetical protein
MGCATPGPRGRDRNRRTHAHYRMETHEALPARTPVRRRRPRRPGQPGTLARAGHRGVVAVSDCPADRPVPPLRARLHVNARTQPTERTMGRTRSVARRGAVSRRREVGPGRAQERWAAPTRCCPHVRSPPFCPCPNAPSGRNGGTGNCPPTGSASTCDGKNAKSTLGSTATPREMRRTGSPSKWVESPFILPCRRLHLIPAYLMPSSLGRAQQMLNAEHAAQRKAGY